MEFFFRDDDDDDEDKPGDIKDTPAISLFFSGKTANTTTTKKHQFFTDRCLHKVSSLT
jgi:hypothetical protein